MDDIGIAANDAEHLIANLTATFECIRETGLKLTMHKCHFGATDIDFPGRTITPEGVKPQKKNYQLLGKDKIPEVQESLQRYLGFLNYYRNFIREICSILPTRILQRDQQRFDRCIQLALKQPLPNKQLVLMTDASFTAAGYAILTEDDQNLKYTSVKKSYAQIAYGSKTFNPSQLKISKYATEILAIYYAFKEFGHIFWEHLNL